MDGGWDHILVSDKGKSNTVIITVDPQDDTKPRHLQYPNRSCEVSAS